MAKRHIEAFQEVAAKQTIMQIQDVTFLEVGRLLGDEIQVLGGLEPGDRIVTAGAAFLAVKIGIVVLFLGNRINDTVGFLREFSIPEPVTGGLIVSVLLAVFKLEHLRYRPI